MQVRCVQCDRALEFSGERPLFCGFCGQPIPPEHKDPTAAYLSSTAITSSPLVKPEEVGMVAQAVGRYRLIRPLGSGGMGTVYEAEDSASGRRVAVKVIAADFVASRDAVERFRQEGRLASAIAHPRCVFVLAADEENGRPYIVMELMPGYTLKDLVEKEGPLSPERAVALILDVIDGLQEAHQNGLIHRDVKPSNCFLQADGRVKIGDFGLSKSLGGSAHLTRTGTFLGTPLFASPEQVRGEFVDQQTDVYSVAATLYYLLTGKAPFQSADAAITLARLASDPPPPMRKVRPELPAVLDKVVLRGLERHRERRWRSLEALRAALVPFVPSRLSIGGMGIRLAAYVLDFIVLLPLTWATIIISVWAGHWANVDTVTNWLVQNLSIALTVVYYSLLEGIWGCSLGKRWLRLRVCRTSGTEPPGLARSLARAFLWNVCLNGLALVFSFLNGPMGIAPHPTFALLSAVMMFVGIALVLSTMRARNGYRAPYEFLTGTRVVQLPWPARRRIYHTRPLNDARKQPAGLPQQIGPFAVQGALLAAVDTQLLQAEDKSLGRIVWLWLRPGTQPLLTSARREIGRSTRLRWLNCGRHEDWQWDAFLAPTGGLIKDLEKRSNPLRWPAARPLLEQLAEELTIAQAEGTLPAFLCVDQVWVQPNGRLHLLDMPIAQDITDAERTTAPADNCSSLTTLAQTAVLLLEGSLRPADAPPLPVHAPVPGHAEAFLGRLLGVGEPYQDVRQFHADLATTHEQPAEVSRSRRAAHLGILAFLLFMGSGCCLMPVFSSPGFIRAYELTSQIHQGEQTLTRLRDAAPLHLATGLINPTAGLRIAAAGNWAADNELKRRLFRRVALWQEDLLERERMLSFTSKFALLAGQSGRMISETPLAKSYASINEVRWLALSLAESTPPSERETIGPMVVFLTILLVWPAAWVIWSFIFRGGFSHGFAGIAIVRLDGRRISRLCSAWRTFLFWLPVVGLMTVSIVLDTWFWFHWDPHSENAFYLLAPWLSAIAWWTALLLVPLYAVVALLWPTRSLHDRLAGTCLVPK